MKVGDFNSYRRLVRNPQIARAARFEPARDRQAAERLFRDDLNATSFAITLKGRMIGLVTLYATIGPDSGPDDSRLELAYMMSPDFQGRGYMTRALRLLIGMLKRHRRVKRLLALVDENNRASQRVLQKNRFVSYRSVLDMRTGHENRVYQRDLIDKG